jgi:cytochrome c oxidase cbb3-type subunit 3
VTDSSGRQYTGEVRLLTNYDVAIEDRAGWYHSWPLGAIKLDVKDPLVAHRQLLSRLTDSKMHDMLAYLETLK